ncbi:beta-ketoacyl-ACP synthase III [Butyrivibrio sp. NC3005]|uniref:beta-ketoacyl-ACP synthase III n=1 Tax=Butyrivibrio sp. NC3005 TaxID=1280685 RepID=UPI0004186E0A|nr:beta-ketoacyl-ACP synthase III [Butyrivibrio sp. NC3005]
MKGLQIISVGAAHPSKVVTNDDLSKIVETSDEWISSRTGIHSRFFCGDGESCVSMAIESSKAALERSGLEKEKIGCVIVATISGDYATPSVACMVQRALALREDIPVLDVNAACSGFIYALSVCQGLLEANGEKYGLVVGMEQLSRLLNMEDRSTCVLFGDGGGSVIVEQSENAVFKSVLGAKGGEEILCGGAGTKDQTIKMDGGAVFKFAVTALPYCMKKLFSFEKEDGKNYSIDDISQVICHQANSRIIDHCVKKLKANPDKFYKNMDHFGNTSAGSIPLAIEELWRMGRLDENCKLMLIGFGSGLTWGGCIISFNAKRP